LAGRALRGHGRRPRARLRPGRPLRASLFRCARPLRSPRAGALSGWRGSPSGRALGDLPRFRRDAVRARRPGTGLSRGISRRGAHSESFVLLAGRAKMTPGEHVPVCEPDDQVDSRWSAKRRVRRETRRARDCALRVRQTAFGAAVNGRRVTARRPGVRCYQSTDEVTATAGFSSRISLARMTSRHQWALAFGIRCWVE
jgi:hypothetical protein